MLTRGRVMDDQAPLKVQSFATGKCEIASQSLQSIYARKDVRIDVFGESQNFAMRTTCAAFGALTLVRSDVTDWRFTRDLNSLVLIKMPLFGSRLDYASGLRRQEAYPLRGAGVGRPFETVTMTRARGGSLSLYAPIERLIERAEALAGKSCGAALISKMADYLDLSAPVCAAFARAAKTAMAEMTSLDSIGLGALAVAGFEDMLLNLAAGSLFAGVIRKFDATPSNCGQFRHSARARLYRRTCGRTDRPGPIGGRPRRQHAGDAGEFPQMLRIFAARLHPRLSPRARAPAPPGGRRDNVGHAGRNGQRLHRPWPFLGQVPREVRRAAVGDAALRPPPVFLTAPPAISAPTKSV